MNSLFHPHFVFTRKIYKELKIIEKISQKVSHHPLSNAKFHKAWQITKNDLISYFRFIEDSPKNELQGYLQALDLQKSWVEKKLPVTLGRIKQLHSCLFGRSSPSPFRKRQNAIYNWDLTEIYYMPPKPEEVPLWMKALVEWVNHSQLLPAPVVAAVAHFGFNSIHPYSDGNGRTARLLTRWILGLKGCHLGELYCLEKFYAKDLERYYDALSIGNIKTFRERLSDSDITSWIEYFCEGMAKSFYVSYKKIHLL